MPYFLFRQNATGGSFICTDDVEQWTFLEARDAEQANSRAEEIGVFFDGLCPIDDWNECESCGDRWERVTDDDALDRLEDCKVLPEYYFVVTSDRFERVPLDPLPFYNRLRYWKLHVDRWERRGNLIYEEEMY